MRNKLIKFLSNIFRSGTEESSGRFMSIIIVLTFCLCSFIFTSVICYKTLRSTFTDYSGAAIFIGSLVGGIGAGLAGKHYFDKNENAAKQIEKGSN